MRFISINDVELKLHDCFKYLSDYCEDIDEQTLSFIKDVIFHKIRELSAEKGKEVDIDDIIEKLNLISSKEQ